jgi:hypothetical protein
MLGRTAPTESGFESRGPERCEALFCSRVSFLTGAAVADSAGAPVVAVSDSGSAGLTADEGVGLFNRSAARAPDMRISSSVGLLELALFSRDFDFFGVSPGGSEGICSGDGVAGLAVSGFVSRATMTSCG